MDHWCGDARMFECSRFGGLPLWACVLPNHAITDSPQSHPKILALPIVMNATRKRLESRHLTAKKLQLPNFNTLYSPNEPI